MLPIHALGWRLLALLVLPTPLIAEAGVAAAGIDEPPSVTVRYHDLNLDTRDGISNLYGRIHAAAVDVCRSVEGPQLANRVFWSEWKSCINHATANAVHAVRNENLSAYHWERIRGWKLRAAAAPASATEH